MRVVIDTNVFISGIYFGGEPRKVLDLIQEKGITPCFILSTFIEFKRLLYHKKFDKQRGLLSFSIDDFLNKLKSYSLIFPQPSKIPKIIKEDLADNHILTCALIGRVSFIITGNKHLLKVRRFQDIFILTPREFLKKLK